MFSAVDAVIRTGPGFIMAPGAGTAENVFSSGKQPSGKMKVTMLTGNTICALI